MAELLLGAVVLLAVAALVADRYGHGGVEVLTFLALVVLDLAMMGALLVTATAENCEGSGQWECSRGVQIGLALGVVGATFGLGALLARARD